MKLILIVLTMLLASHTMASFAHTYPVADTTFSPSDSNQLYFPLIKSNDPSTEDVLESFLDTWYSQQLFALREPVIFYEQTQNEIYRFTWLRSFHHPIAIRIERHADKYFLFWKMGSGAGGYSPGKLTVDKQISIDKAIWDEFKKWLEQSDFWNMQTNVRVFGADGAEWILEGKTNEKYHFVTRWSPKKESNYYQCCNMLIELTDLNIKRREKY